MNRRRFCMALPGLWAATASACSRQHRHPVEPGPSHTAQPVRLESPSDTPERSETGTITGTDHVESIPLRWHYPLLAQKIPYIPLGAFPTAADKATHLGRHLGVGELYVKRDDLSGDRYGGGKVRKLEFFLADAKQSGKAVVVTSGAVGSNHALATTIYATGLGLKTILMLLPQPPSRHVRHNLLADAHFGAELRAFRDPHRVIVQREAPAPYVIPAGGTSVLGNTGFVNAAFELRAQIERNLLPEPDLLYIALGTMGSAAGLIVGLKAAGLKTKVISVRASTLATANEQKLARMCRDTSDYLRSLDGSFPKLSFSGDDATIVHGYVGGGYSVPTTKGTRAVKIFEEHTGIALETTYTGKAFAALADDAPKLSNKVVLFWNTYNSRTIDLADAGIDEVPPAFRAYFHLTGGS